MSEDVPTVGKYQLISKIADGGMAEVFLARFVTPTGFEKRVALKKILPHFVKDPAFVSSFTNEAKICGLLQHPNIVQVYDFKLEGSQLSLAMEFIEGLDLERVITHQKLKRRVLDTVEVAQIVVQILDGLQYAHDATAMNPMTQKVEPLKIVHRDLKPSNILIDTIGQVKIVDFGVAKASTNINKTMNQGTAKGTVSYMSPEQASGKLDLTPSSDVFSVGCMLYEMLTGNRLFDGDNLFAILDQVRSAPLEPYIEQVYEKFRPVLRRALTRELSPHGDAGHPGRYPTAASMRADVVKIFPDAGSTSGLAALVDRLWREGLAIPGRVNPGRTPSSLSVPMIERPGSSPVPPRPQGRPQLASLTRSDHDVAAEAIAPGAFANLPEPAPEDTEITNPWAMSARHLPGMVSPPLHEAPARLHEAPARLHEAPRPSRASLVEHAHLDPLLHVGGARSGGSPAWTPPVPQSSVPQSSVSQSSVSLGAPGHGAPVHVGQGARVPLGSAQAMPPQSPQWGGPDPYEATAMGRDLPAAEPVRAVVLPAGRTSVSDLPTTAAEVPPLAGGFAHEPPRAFPGGWEGAGAGMGSAPGGGPVQAGYGAPVHSGPSGFMGPATGGGPVQAGYGAPVHSGTTGFSAWQVPAPAAAPPPLGEPLLDMPIVYRAQGGNAGLATKPLPVGTSPVAASRPVRRWGLVLVVLVVGCLVAAAIATIAGVF